MTEALALSSNRFPFNSIPERQIKSHIIEFAVISSKNPLQQRNELASVCKEWAQMSDSDTMILKLLALGLKVKEVILKSWSYSEPVLVKAWSALFQEKFDLVNDNSYEFDILWDEEEAEEIQTTHQRNLQELMEWLERLEAPYRAFIQSANFSKKNLTPHECFEILKKLPGLTCLTYDARGYDNPIKDDHVNEFFSHCPKLEELSLSSVTLSEKGYADLFSNCSSLKTFHLTYAYGRYLNLFEILPSQIATLTLQYISRVTSKGLIDFLQRSNLEMLELSGCKRFFRRDA